ncbi:MAG: hypothetical protein IJT19_10345 [Bacteroidaceae bacterium]|nr:hypothetical protein [Bacteroidaceae bacterium]
MKKARNLIALLALCALAGCKPTPKEQPQNVVEEDTVVVTIVPDSTLWGRLGEDTGMSTLQFITNRGDTMDIYRTNQYTGEDGLLLGEIRDLKDRFAITVAADGESLLTAVNVSQLMQRWQTEKGRMTIENDGTVTSQDLPYRSWQLWNGHILLTSTQQTEYSTVSRTDTMDIVTLDRDSLIIRDHLNQLIKFRKTRN